MSPLKCAVIGVGYLGRFHAQKYNMLDTAELVAVCDMNPDACEAVSRELQVPAYYNYRDLFSHVDAVSIAVTTQKHYAIAKEFLSHGIHVLIEKPITETLEQADELITMAQDQNLVLQVGHLERFNAARLAIEPYLDQPVFIESQRLAPFNPRGADVNVILDLMIHDLDLIQTMVHSPLVSIEAQGTPVLSSAIDIANARLTFANHCVANVTASRVSYTTERKMRIFQKKSYLSVDYQHKKFAVFEKGHDEIFPGIPNVIQTQSTFEQTDALFEEIKSFVHCIQHKEKPWVSGQDAYNALATALQITSLINKNLHTLHATI